MAWSRSSARRVLVTALATATAAVALAGCAGGAPAPTVTVTETETTSATVTASPSDSPAPSPTDGASGCLTSSLSASAGDTPGGGAAGSFGIRITLTNTGSTDCFLQGWPGVSFVGDGNGTQLGQPSDFDRDSPNPTVTLAAGGGAAYVDVRVAEAGNYSTDECGPTPADGFRIFPPGETNALFAATTGLTACSNTDVHLLTSGAMQPAS